ncbi:hypothetical protein AQUCO_01300014v1 [Aquilegia coerulea]|uniref:DUF7725 domain-containing protein n=1 Tax=Aquilegia coerulea TaxID=218851 RepID=A0A2G5DZ67_AQUCA|nr:hypothetical protein AQUCO_01300014v1 [Aquilegia coerulea]
MEPTTTTTTAVPNGRVASISSSSSSSSQPIRKEWRAISDHPIRDHPIRNSSSNEELDRLKLGDERTIYEQSQTDVDYCSIALDPTATTLDNDLLQQRLHDISMQRERLQHMEIDLRAQIGTRSHLIEMQNTFTNQINEQINAVANLKERLQEREQAIRELELKMEEKDRELRAIKIDNEAAWAKEDLIREQNQEILAYRREHDNYEAERAQQLQQIHELKEHIQEKERQYLKLEEQHRVLQETILYKDEQLREAQAWVQRMDAMQSTTNHSLQSELRERTEQFNHFWLGCQRQFADMERHHLQAIQQLQLELAEARQRSGIYTDESSIDRANSEEASSFGQTKGTQFTVNEDGTISSNPRVVPNGNLDDYQPFAAFGNAPVKTEHAPGVPFPSSVLGLGAYIPPGQVTALHPFFIPQQGVPHSVPPTNSHVSESHLGHFLPMPASSSHQEWQNQQAVADGSQLANQNQFQALQTEQSISSSHGQFVYEQSADGHIPHPGYVVANIAPTQETGSAISASHEEAQGLVYPQPQQKQENSPEFHEAMKLDSFDKKVETKVTDDATTKLTSKEGQGMITEKQQSAASVQQSTNPSHLLHSGVAKECNESSVVLPESSISSGRTSNLMAAGNVLEPKLLDERSLLACIVRAIPAGSGGRIRISSTLPNRLGKMLAPLHWHDYKKKYGKLDEFVAVHPELFVIEGDAIQLREGAQEIISATTAIAKVAAAAAASAPYSSVLPSVAVTPMAQTHRIKKVPSIDSKPGKIGSSDVLLAPADTGDKFSQQSRMQNQHSNGVYSICQGLTNVKILSKPKLEVNGMQSEIRSSSVHGTNSDGTRLATHTNKGTTNVRPGNFGGKQQARDIGAAAVSRR